MGKFWLDIFIDAFGKSLEFMGKSWSEILRSLLLFLAIAALTMRRKGWPKSKSELLLKVKANIPKDIGIFVALFAVVLLYQMSVSAYGAWLDERTRRSDADTKFLALKAEYDKLDSPDFRVEILNIYSAPAGDPTNVIVGVMSRISNFGADSSVINFKIEVKFDENRILKGLIASGDSNPKMQIDLLKDATGKQISMNGSDYWLSQLPTIPRNSVKDGALFALVKGTTQKEMVERNATVVFSCSDARGKRSSGELKWTGHGHFGVDPDAIGLHDLQQPLPRTRQR